MIISLQSLAVFIGQDFATWDTSKKATATQHIQLAGQEVRGALASLYSIPIYTRDASGNILTPYAAVIGSSKDPVNSALGPVVSYLAAAFLINPARGFQAQEERSAADEYRIAGRAQLKQLQNGTALVADSSLLADFGIELTDAGSSMVISSTTPSAAALRPASDGIFGVLREP
jgi:hypothetical protein